MSKPLTLAQLLPIRALPIVPYPSGISVPSVFISYSQFSTEHKDWVSLLARKINKLGIQVNYDGNFDGRQRFDRFMESIVENDFVICVLSASYVEKIKKDDPCGVVTEVNIIRDRATECHLNNFVIPVLKDSASDRKSKIPPFLKNIRYWNLDDDKKAPEEFSKMVCRILDIENKILNKFPSTPEGYDKRQKSSDIIHSVLANYWNEISGSLQESKISEAFLSGEIFNIPDLSTNAESIVQEKSDNTLYKEKDINLLGRWDYSCPGDQEILKLLAGDSDDE